MNTAAVRANRRKLLILAAIVLLCAAGYMLVEVNFSNPKLLAYAMKIRTPKLIVMLITAFPSAVPLWYSSLSLTTPS